MYSEKTIPLKTLNGLNTKSFSNSAKQAHEALLNYFDEVAVKSEIEKLYLEVMGGTIFNANESNREQDISKLKETLAGANKKLASLEEKYVLNEIERDSYSFMKPRFKMKYPSSGKS